MAPPSSFVRRQTIGETEAKVKAGIVLDGSTPPSRAVAGGWDRKKID
jgi:hypothetical protein